EIYVGGEGVARGYINNKELTDSRFIKNPFKEGDRLYKSGDLATMLPTGDLEYKGRNDRQVQLKGFRIELKEIEHHLSQYKFIDDAVVVKKGSKNNAPFLCAYYIAEKKIDTSALRSYLEGKLPHYMIPSYYVKIEEIPFTSNNKIDAARLPEPKTGLSGSVNVAPTNEEEVVICEIWQEYLDVDKVGILDNFFSLGGDSLKAIGLISKINERLSSSLTIADIYSSLTIKEQTKKVKSIERKKYHQLKKEAKKKLFSFLEEYKKNHSFLDSYEEVYPMNGIEKGMVFHSLKGKFINNDVDTIMYHEQNMYPLKDENFDFEIFKKALILVIKKHSEFRKIYDLDNLAHIVLKDIEPEIHFIDISDKDEKEQQEFLTAKCREEQLKETNLSLSLIWRMHIIKTKKDLQYLLFDFNHSLIDGWSLSIFLTELNSTCLALTKDENYVPSPIQGSYKDQIIEEQAALENESSKAYWKKELLNYKRFGLLPTGLPHKVMTNNYN